MANGKEQAVQEKIKTLENIKSDFITVASHQLRTPISAIRWSLDLLLSGRAGKLTERQLEVIKEAYHNNKLMVKTVNDLLRIARFEEKGIQLTPRKANVSSLLRQLIKKQTPFAKAANCQIILRVATKNPQAYFDSLNIEMVFDALIDNAIFYNTPGRKGKITISISNPKDYLLIKFQDNGIGIPKNQQHLVFSKFFRGRNALRTQTEGLGLNLYLAKKIIEGLGGKINFVSTENKGTTFNVYLPTNKQHIDDLINIQGEKKESKNALEREREFVSITVHELKAPLGSSKWSLEVLKSQKLGKLNSEQLELIEQVYHGNERLLVLVRDLLNLSKLQEGKFEVKPTAARLEKIIDEVVKGFTPEAQKKKLKLAWKKQLYKKVPMVQADASRVAQVATNIISNAIKYTPSGGSVTIALKRQSGEALHQISDTLSTANIIHTKNHKGYLIISVKDTGIGISDKDKNKMFGKFFRSKRVLESEAEGTGLGLYITKSIIDLHQGDIWFTSELGQGSTFFFSLPVT